MLGKVLSVVNEKGGAGKTTCAVNLGCTLRLMGFEVIIYDADEQASATEWMNLAVEEDEVSPLWPMMAAPGGSKIKKEIEALKRAYDFVIIDTPGTLVGEALTLIYQSISASDLAVVPLKPRPSDLVTTKNICDVIRRVQDMQEDQPPAYIWLNQIKNRAGTKMERAIIADAEEEDSLLGFPLLNARSYECEQLANMVGEGECVHDCMDREYVRRHKSAQVEDFTALAGEICSLVGVEPRALARLETLAMAAEG